MLRKFSSTSLRQHRQQRSFRVMDAVLSSMNYDANKLPLGKLAKSTILNGFAALKVLSEVIGQPDGTVSKSHGGFRKAVEDLTGRYYSYAPLPSIVPSSHAPNHGSPIELSRTSSGATARS